MFRLNQDIRKSYGLPSCFCQPNYRKIHEAFWYKYQFYRVFWGADGY